jgi:hypothetical protein
MSRNNRQHNAPPAGATPPPATPVAGEESITRADLGHAEPAGPHDQAEPGKAPPPEGPGGAGRDAGAPDTPATSPADVEELRQLRQRVAELEADRTRFGDLARRLAELEDAQAAAPLPRAGLVELPSPELAVPKGWKLVKDAPTAEEKSLKEQEHFRAEADKTMSQRCQEKALADYPYRDGDTWFRCRLADGNLLPSIVLPAAEKASARARYSELCGVRSSEREVGADRLAGRPEFDWEKAERERLTKPKKKKGEDDE